MVTNFNLKVEFTSDEVREFSNYCKALRRVMVSLRNSNFLEGTVSSSLSDELKSIEYISNDYPHVNNFFDICSHCD